MEKEKDQVKELFKKIASGDDDWEKRFEESVDKEMLTYASRIESTKKLIASDRAAAEQAEVLRTRRALYGIVEERMQARIKELDETVAEAADQLRSAQTKIFDEVLAGYAAGGSSSAASAAACRKAPEPDSSLSSPAAGYSGCSSSPPSPQKTQEAGSTRPTYTSLHSKSHLEVRGGTSQQSPGGLGSRHHGPQKDLSLRQVRDIIHSVYHSKAQHDLKCQAKQEPSETMEQHFYSFLGKRYGLKSVVHEWASAVYMAIKRFASENAEVAVFGKILQNTLAESFPMVQDQLRTSVNTILLQQLKDRHPYRSQPEIETLWKSRNRAGFTIEECEEVVVFMYNEEDSEELMRRIHHAAISSKDQNGEPVQHGHLSMKDMMQVLLNFQMSLTESFLTDFVQIFRQVDTRGEGFLDYQQLEELVRRLSFVEGSEEDATQATLLLEAKAMAYAAVRRFRRGATFSQTVDLFTGLISARWAAINPPETQ